MISEFSLLIEKFDISFRSEKGEYFVIIYSVEKKVI